MEQFEKYVELLSKHKNLKVEHMMLYALIVESCKEFGKCDISNMEFAKSIGVKYDVITRLINGLIAYKLIVRHGEGKTRYLVLN